MSDVTGDALLAVAAQMRVESSAMEWISTRWRRLNDDDGTRPSLLDESGLRDARLETHVTPVDPRLICYVDSSRWGDVNNRYDSFVQMAATLAAQTDHEGVQRWIRDFGSEQVMLDEVLGPNGPIYTWSGNEGRHRIHFAKALGVPLPFQTRHRELKGPGDRVTVWLPRDRSGLHMDAATRIGHQRSVQRQRTDIRAHLARLQRCGFAEPTAPTPMGDTIDLTLRSQLPFSWALALPESVEVHSRWYRAAYSAFGDRDVQAASLSAAKWVAYLESRRPRQTAATLIPRPTSHY